MNDKMEEELCFKDINFEELSDTVLIKAKKLHYDFKNLKSSVDEVKKINKEELRTNFQNVKSNSYNKFFERITIAQSRVDSILADKQSIFKEKIKKYVEDNNKMNETEFDFNVSTSTLVKEDIKKKIEGIFNNSTCSTSLNRKEKVEDKDEDKATSSNATDNSVSFSETKPKNNLNVKKDKQGRKKSKSSENEHSEENQRNLTINNRIVKDLKEIVHDIKELSDFNNIKKMESDMNALLYWQFIGERQDLKTLIVEKQDKICKNIKEQLGSLKKCYFSSESIQNNYIKMVEDNFSINPTSLTNQITLAETSQKAYTIDSVMTAFSINSDTILVAYCTYNFTIEIYNLKESKVVDTLKAHNQHIYIVRHFTDEQNGENHYLLSTGYDKKAIIWFYEENKFINYLTITTDHTGLYLYSGLILFDSTIKNSKDNSHMSIITSVPNELMKIFDSKGKVTRTIGNKTDYTYFINSFFDKKSNSYKIINANSQDVKIIDYKEGKTEKTFKETSNNSWHMSAYIKEMNDGKILLYETDGGGCFRIWDYHQETIIDKIVCNGCSLRGFVLWNDKIVVAASSDKSVKVIDLQTKKIETIKDIHTNVVCSVVKIFHPIYGESLISSAIDGKVKLYHSFNN